MIQPCLHSTKAQMKMEQKKTLNNLLCFTYVRHLSMHLRYGIEAERIVTGLSVNIVEHGSYLIILLPVMGHKKTHNYYEYNTLSNQKC